MDIAEEKSVPSGEAQVKSEEVAVPQQGRFQFERYINLPSVVNFEIIVQAGWETVALTFQFSIINGGPASIVYGGILAAIGATAVALSLAEMASMDPIVGAQYRWSANFAPVAPRFWGLIQGWLTTAAWIFAAATNPATLSNMVTALIIFWNDSYEPKRWHTAMLMWLFILVPLLFNLWFRKLLNVFEMIGGIGHIIFFFVNIITLVVLAKRSTADYVFKTLTHDVSGWTNPGVAFGIGLLTMTFPISGADGLLHMSDEVKHVHTRVPWSIIWATLSNGVMQLVFAICLLFTIGDVDQVTNTRTGLPIIEVYYAATHSKAATTVLVLMSGLIIFFALFNVFASVSRLTWAFSRDHGLPFHNVFAAVNQRFMVPLNALFLISAICFILSLIYIGSSTAYNAIISLTGFGLYSSYIIPILFLVLRKVNGPPLQYGPFRLGRWGIPINVFSLAFLLYIITWMPFPTMLPVTAVNMNYAGPVFLIILLLALGDWMVSGHKRFEVPVVRHMRELEEEKE